LKEGGPVQVWLLDHPESPLGASWTPSFSPWPNDGSASLCSLAEVLENGELPTHYYLSSKQASGILGRAARRGKELPEPIRQALQAIVDLEEQKGKQLSML